MKFSDLEGRVVLTIAGVVSILITIGIITLGILAPNLDANDLALVIASTLGALGTFALALASFYNIVQTNRNLELREKERTKPLVIDELSHLIQPAIATLEINLETLSESDNDGCAFEWVYLDEFSIARGSRGPLSVQTPDSLALARLSNEDRVLYGKLRAHDNYVLEVAEKASEFHEQVKPEVQRLLDKEGITDLSQSLKVITSSILMELNYFGEDHALYEFWEEYRENLIQYSKEAPEVTLDEVQAGERVYLKFADDLLHKLKRRKATLKQEYRISEDEIAPAEDPRWRGL